MYDIVYVGDKNNIWKKLKSKYVTAKIASNFEEAKSKVFTKMFWVVWDDINPSDSFLFDYQPAEWDKDYIHVFKNGNTYDGICLFPKDVNIEDAESRDFDDKKEIDIQASTPIQYEKFDIHNYNDYIEACKNCTTKMFWYIPDDVVDNYDFSYYIPAYDEFHLNIPHVFLNDVHYDGICLFPKNFIVTEEEFSTRIFQNKKEVDIKASTPKPFDTFEIETYEDYCNALENTSTELFWMSSPNINVDKEFTNNFYISHFEIIDRKQNHSFLQEVEGNNRLGLYLCSKYAPVTKKEIEYRHFVNRKEWDITACFPKRYDIYYVDTYEEYKKVLEKSTTEMFWIIPSHVDVAKDFNFDMYFTHDNKYDRERNHIFKNGNYFDGIILCSKQCEISQKEWDYGFVVNKKEVDIKASNPKPYDIVFISYQEPNADKNYQALLDRFPRAKRVDGIKGIHQAHIEAAKICNTLMIWIVDGDAHIDDTFQFDYQVPLWQKDNVFVWRSKNPINDLVYGYGGVKLFPRKETLNMDTSKPDMTTSISGKFNAIEEISNVTVFNTGEFETWKSAFRECAKLSSKIIDRQKNEETEQRLETWCTVGEDRPYGSYALAGARAGREFGLSNRDDLKLINDFDWLKEKFDGEYNES